MTRIVCAGEAMIEMAPTSGTDTYKRSFAGDTFNTAWYLARLRNKWTIDFATMIGRDKISDAFCSFANASGVGTAHAQRHDSRTLGLYLIELDNAERSFQYWRDRSAARLMADDTGALAAGLENADLIYFSGITLAILADERREQFLDAVEIAKSHGAQVAFDPNLRPRLWPDLNAMRVAITKGALVADLVLPSFEEEAAIFGDATETDTIARYQAAGVGSVIVKNGAGLIYFASKAETGSVAPYTAPRVVDTTAAGDSFNAAFIAGYLDRSDTETAIAAACKLSSHVIGHHGALVELPDDTVG